MKRALLSVMLATSVVVLAVAAQAPPDLSGTWRPENPMSGQVNPFEFTITQTPDAVTLRIPLNNPETVTLKLNGEETRTQVDGGRAYGTTTSASCLADANEGPAGLERL